MQKSIDSHSYDLHPYLYDLRGFLILSFSYRNSLFYQLKFFAENIKGKHLECAVGTGTFTKLCLLHKRLFLRKQESEVFAVDYSDTLLSGARKRLKGAVVLKEDLRKMSFESNSFDSVNLPNGFHTIDGINEALKEIHRVLKPNGSLYVNILTPPKNRFLDGISRWVNRYGMRIGILKRPYSQEESVKFLEDFGFDISTQEINANCLYLKCKRRALQKRVFPPAQA